MTAESESNSFTALAAFAARMCEGDLLEAVLRLEEHEKKSRTEILNIMRGNFKHMQTVIRRSFDEHGLAEKAERLTILDGLDSRRIYGSKNRLTTGLGKVINLAQAYALASSEAGAAGKAIVKAPTAGSVGVIPGTFLPLAEQLGISEDEIVHGLIIAARVGRIVYERATFAAAEAGCGAEVGVATCMAAGGVAWIFGRDIAAVESAAALAMQNYLGLECSSIAGAVEVPCAHRCAIGAVTALITANMSLSGVRFPLPLDQVVDVMYEIGKALPAKYKETQRGGLAKTPAGQSLAKIAYKKRRQQLECLNCNACAPKDDTEER